MEQELSKKDLVKLVVSRYLMALLAMGVLFFVPAGTLDYWQAWVYLIILFLPMLFLILYLLKNNPALLARRMKTRETEVQQSLIIKLSFIPFLVAFILPGFDHRLGWSSITPFWVILADALVLAGYGIVIWVFRENQYASRVVEVSDSQSVISSGPYHHVRHPMYVGILLIYILSPLALGSLWAVIPAVFILPVIIFRILNEEKVLARDLSGYTAYMQQTRYRLMPGIW